MTKTFISTHTEPVVQTKAGKLRGYITDGTYTFHGIKYADARRFQMPTEVQPWKGVKDALAYGYVCPLLQQPRLSNEVLVPHRFWPMDEHCQSLNVWTRSVDPEAKKPVMVWLHGGGFTAGSSIEHVAYDGENMSKYGDVVVVSINHRLNILGHFNLEPYDGKYANSGNVGVADMVAALHWIRDNIENFGGDPGNVTLFGQSGGGMKVWVLMQTPAANGLFHKGIIQSGVVDDLKSPKTDSSMLVSSMLDELGLTESSIKLLEIMPYERLAEAYLKVVRAVKQAGEYVGCAPMVNDYYLGHPCSVGFTDHAKTIPVLAGTVFGEFNWQRGVDKSKLSAEKTDALLVEKFGDAAEELKVLFIKAYPDKNPVDLLDLDYVFREFTKDFIAKKSCHPEAPTYSYLLAFDFPLDNGKPAWHCAEIPLVFHNADKVPAYNQPGVIDKLEAQMFDAWINFARTGNPGHDDLPAWPACTPGDEATMIFDRKCQVRHNHDDALYALYTTVSPKFGKMDPDN